LKLYPNLVEVVHQSLSDVFRDGRPVDRVVSYYLKGNPKWGSRDRSFIAESVYDMVRNWYFLWALIDEQPEFKRDKLFRLFAAYHIYKGRELPSWTEFEGVDVDAINERASFSFERNIQYSVNAELDHLGESQLGLQWEVELKAMNDPAPVFIRVNTLKTNRDELAAELLTTNIPTERVPNVPDGLKLLTRTNIYTHPLFMKGLFEIQDAGSQLIAPFMNLQPGLRVIDACAGAGGKSLHIAALMENKGRLIALDVEPRKLEELSRRSRRNTVSIIEVRPIESTKVIKRLAGQGDRLLLDVPCSGTGVLRRNPDTKYRIKQETIDNLTKTQQQILQQYAPMLKVGGEMVYATCSILPVENRPQVDLFLKNNPNFSFIEDHMVYPSQNDSDGFYMARLKRIA
jgi:16S rRNA (cytosine967-C5)-methyltransferase